MGKVWKRARVVVYSLLTITSAALQSVSFKKVGYSLEKIPYAVLLLVSLSFVPILFAVVWWVDRVYGFLPETKTFALKKTFFKLGFLNAINGVLIIFSNPHVSGIAQSALAQAVIPLTLASSVCYLNTRFTKLQLVGAAVVLLGVASEFTPFVFPQGNAGSSGKTSVFFAATFCLGQLPAAFSGVYQEHAFSQARVNVVYMMAYSSLAQFVSLILLAPVNFIPKFGDTSPDAFFNSLYDAGRCVMNVYDGHPECEGAGTMLLCCIATMLSTQIFQTLLVKVSSASFVVICMTLITPVSSICFTFSFLMGKHVEVLSSIQIGALGVLLVGIALYRCEDTFLLESSKLDDAIADSKVTEQKSVNSGNKLDKLLLDRQDSTRSNSSGPRTKPMLMPTRCGIINSEYTAGGFRKTSFTDWEGSVFFEATKYELNQLKLSQSLDETKSPHSYLLRNDGMLSRSYDGSHDIA